MSEITGNLFLRTTTNGGGMSVLRLTTSEKAQALVYWSFPYIPLLYLCRCVEALLWNESFQRYVLHPTNTSNLPHQATNVTWIIVK